LIVLLMGHTQRLLQEMPWHNKVLRGSSVMGLPPSLIWMIHDNDIPYISK